MVDSSGDTRANSEDFQYKLEVIEYQIKKATKPFLVDDDGSIFFVETEDGDVIRVLLAQLLRTLKKEQFLMPNYNVVFTDFSDFTTMSIKQNGEWADNFPDLLVCKLDKDKEEKLEEQFHILKSWVNIVKDESKKILFIAEDSKHLQKAMKKIGMANIFIWKLNKLWKENETTSNNEAISEVKNNKAKLDEQNVVHESTSARALDEDTNVNVVEKENQRMSLHGEATTTDNADLVNLLQSLGVGELDAVDEDGDTQLHLAARDGKTQIVESLLAHGAKKDIQNTRGSTALHLATGRGHGAIVHMLLAYGFNVNATNNFQYTPLHYACDHHDDAHSIEILLKFGAGIERKDKYGQTTLHRACFRGHLKVVTSLLKHGANINAQDKDGDTPLHKATSWNKPKIVLILLDQGADLSIKNKRQKKVLDLARSKKLLNSNLIRIFETHKK